MELHRLREELLQPFSPDEGIAGLDMQLNKAHSWTSAQFHRNVSFDEVTQDLPGYTYYLLFCYLSMSFVQRYLINWDHEISGCRAQRRPHQ